MTVPSMSDQAIPCHRHDPTERPTQKPRRVGMTAASADTAHGPRGQAMCSVTAMRQAQNRAIPDTPRPKVLLSRAISALAERTLRIPIPNTDVVASNGFGRRLTGVSAGQSLCGAPRRNRTGDPILTVNLAATAVRTSVSAGRWRP
jgi:hypothetical protein